MKSIDRLRLAQFGNLELLAKQVVEGFITGLHKSPFHGFSVEFADRLEIVCQNGSFVYQTV